MTTDQAGGPALFLLIAVVALITPGDRLRRGSPSTVGFGMPALAVGVSIAYAVFTGFMAYGTCQETDNTFVLFEMAITLGLLMATAYAVWCAAVRLKRLEPKASGIVATILVGLAIGGLIVGLTHLILG